MFAATPVRLLRLSAVLAAAVLLFAGCASRQGFEGFDIRSANSGPWSDVSTWRPQREPRAGDRVLIQPAHRVTYDVQGKEVIRSIAVAGTLAFAPDRNTELNVGVVTVYG